MDNITIFTSDNTQEAFSLDKIMNAIIKAFHSVNESVDLGRISKILSNLDIHYGVTVEDIQNQTEVALMKEGYYMVAKSLMLYRKRHYETQRKSTNRTWEYGEPTQYELGSSRCWDNLNPLVLCGSAKFHHRIAKLSTIQKLRKEVEDVIELSKVTDDPEVINEKQSSIRLDKRFFNGAKKLVIKDEFVMQMAKVYNAITGNNIDEENIEDVKDFIISYINQFIEKIRGGLMGAVAGICRTVSKAWGYIHGLGVRTVQMMISLLNNRDEATYYQLDRIRRIDQWSESIIKVMSEDSSLAFAA